MNGKQLSVAWKAWLASPEGVRCSDMIGLSLRPADRKYLLNRLELAFQAGVRAAESEAAALRTALRITSRD